MIDMRMSRLRKSLRERIICSVSPGIATNRMICTHGSVAMKKFIEQEQHHAVQQSLEKDNCDNYNTGGYWGTVFDDDRIQENGTRSVTEVDYTSKLSRNFFPANPTTRD